MTQDGDNFARIEAALDRQVAVNADLRTSVTELRTTADALLQVVTIYQHNFEQLAVEINADRQAWRSQMDRIVAEAETDRHAWQAESRRIWEYLLGNSGNGRGEQAAPEQ